jgi:hypothetical protein
MFIKIRTSSVTFLIIVGWAPHFVGVKPQVYVPTYQGYVPWDGLEDGLNPGIDDQFYINPKNERACRDSPCKSTQEPYRNIVRVWIVSLVHTLGVPCAAAPFTHPDG